MLRVKTRLQSSPVHGIGLFADQFIPKGTVTWEYDPMFDVGFTEEQLKDLPELTREFLLFYCYLDANLGKFILCADNQRYINHTKNAEAENITSTPEQDVAQRDIQEGEELLCDYNKFDDAYFTRHGIENHALN